jgi:ketosteroid isomerase-like protein
MTRRLPGLVIIAAAVLLSAAGYLALRNRQSDEEKIVRALLATADAVERKDVRGIMAVVSEEYHDSSGLTWRVLKLLAWRAREIEERLRVAMGAPKVTVKDRRASVEVGVTVYVIDASARSQVLFEGPVNLTMRKEKRGHWRVVDSEGWQQTIEVEQGF